MTRSKRASENKQVESFETSIARLEELVKSLESDDSSLADSLTAFESGIGLTRDLQTKLSEAEQKVRLLMDSNGEASVEDFPSEDNEH